MWLPYVALAAALVGSLESRGSIPPRFRPWVRLAVTALAVRLFLLPIQLEEWSLGQVVLRVGLLAGAWTGVWSATDRLPCPAVLSRSPCWHTRPRHSPRLASAPRHALAKVLQDELERANRSPCARVAQRAVGPCLRSPHVRSVRAAVDQFLVGRWCRGRVGRRGQPSPRRRACLPSPCR